MKVNKSSNNKHACNIDFASLNRPTACIQRANAILPPLSTPQPSPVNIASSEVKKAM